MANWKRTFWAVWIANMLTAVGMQSFLPFFPSHLAELGLTDRGEIATWSGLVYGAAPLSAALMSPVWGAIGDRFGRRLMVLRAMLAITLFVGAMAFVRTPAQLLALRVLQGVFSGFIPPSLTLVSISAPPERQGRISASLQVALATGAILGPLLGAAVRSRFGVHEVYLVVAGASAVGGLLVGLLAHEDPTQRRSGGSLAPGALLRGTVADVRELWARPNLRAAVLLLFCVQLGLGATHPVLELHVRDLTDASPERVAQLTGLLFSVLAAANLLSIHAWGRFGDARGHGPTLLLCAWISGSALLLHALAPVYLMLLAARALLGTGSAGVAPCAFGVAAAETSADRRGGAFGVVFSARALAVALAAMAGGVLSAWLGIRGLFVVGGVLVLVAAWALRGLTRSAPSTTG